MKRLIHKTCGLGLIVSLSAIGCATPRQDIVYDDNARQVVKAEIIRFYGWLLNTRQLLTPVKPYHKTQPKPRRVDPKTPEALLDPKHRVPTIREVIKKLELERNKV